MHSTMRAPLQVLLSSLVVAVLAGGCAELHDGTGFAPTGLATTYAAATGPAAGPVAAPTPLTIEGVSFTAAEAEAVLAFVNHATLAELDAEVGIDVRAAESIVAAQPIASIGELAGLYFVGPVTLEILKAFAVEAEAQRTLAAIAVAPSVRS
ncbi:MAG: hypothetical protein RIT45_3534 [Pseudomonadota bacterium]